MHSSAALGSSALNATHDVIENDYGRDAVQVADDAGLAAANTGKVASASCAPSCEPR